MRDASERRATSARSTTGNGSENLEEVLSSQVTRCSSFELNQGGPLQGLKILSAAGERKMESSGIL